jgi:hypothetical protein
MPSTIRQGVASGRRARSWQRVLGSRVTCPGCGCAVSVRPSDRNGWQIEHACPPAGAVEVHVKRAGTLPWAWRYSSGYGAG